MSNVNNNYTFLTLTTKKNVKISQEDLKKLQEAQDSGQAISLFIKTEPAATNPIESYTGDSDTQNQTQEELANNISIVINGYNATVESMTEDDGSREIGAITDDGSTSYFQADTAEEANNTQAAKGATSSDPTYLEYYNEIQSAMGVNNTEETAETNDTQATDGTQVTVTTQGDGSIQITINPSSADGTEETSETDGVNTTENESGISDEEYNDKYGVRDGFDPQAVATALHDAMKGWGTDEERVLKYLDTQGEDALNDAEIREVMDAYKEKYGKELEQDIKGDFSGSDQKQLLARLSNAEEGLSEKYAKMSDEDKEQLVHELAGKLYDSMYGAGTDEETMLQILQLDPTLAKDVIDYYNDSPYADKKDFKTKADHEVSGGYQDKLDELYNNIMDVDVDAEDDKNVKKEED